MAEQKTLDNSELRGFKKALLLQQRAAALGFDWPSIEPVFAKLQEETAELKQEIDQAIQAGETSPALQARMQDELGDVLFCCVNLARFMGVDAGLALEATNRKFERRFNYIERFAASQGRSFDSFSLEELDQIWNRAKADGL